MRLLLNVFNMFYFDFKTMGLTFFVPILAFFFTTLFLLISKGHPIETDIIMIQGLFIPFTCWVLMYRLNELYEEGAQETLIPYYARTFIYDTLRYLTVNIICILLLSSLLVIKFGLDSFSIISLIHFFLLTLFFMFLGTALLVLIRNIESSLTIIFIYSIIEVVTLGEFMPWPHIFIFDSPSFNIFIIIKFITLFFSIIFLFFITSFFLRKIDRGIINVPSRLKLLFTRGHN
ncbi:hypothetical protein LAV72_18285 [Lysinibacillus xylanilyticus]|uniref:hypothetical protein n=1 Tax=Lysinibacillus xylanilyticus TaxID=582475 RepID=UPI002B24DFAE|nr:hypothetical protein [Lysinibacillus xylanilyticus]MEB2301555.1 hypothetical protein [Lysinibacillus xylanilyticus]